MTLGQSTGQRRQDLFVLNECNRLFSSTVPSGLARIALMTSRRSVSGAVVVILAALSCATNAQVRPIENQPTSQSLRVEIKSKKSVYAAGEPVLFTAILRNDGNGSVYISKHFFEAGGGIAGFYVNVRQVTGKPSGKKCVAAGDRYPNESRTPEQVLREDYLLLPPGAMVGVEAEFFTGCVVRNPGVYEATAVYSAQDLNVNHVKQVALSPDQIVTGQFYSPPSRFRIR